MQQRKLLQEQRLDVAHDVAREQSELSLPLQGKPLRFRQERRFDRVGGRRTLEADVRIVAASSRNLADMVRLGSFRSSISCRNRDRARHQALPVPVSQWSRTVASVRAARSILS